jgi:tetratricopeptide (TPR) repeat protein
MPSDRWEEVAEAVELLNEGDVEGAIQKLRVVAAHDPHNADAHYQLGRALGRLQQFGAATVALQMALRQEPAFLGAWVELALCQRELGHLDDAIRSGERALALREDDPDALHALGVAHAERAGDGDFEVAARYLARFVALRGVAAEARLDAEVLLKAITQKLAQAAKSN